MLEAGIGRAAAAAGLAAGVIDEEQSLRVVDRQRLDQHGVDQAEDRRVGANPEPERQQGHQRERRRPPQKPECVADVAAQLVDQPQANGVAALLLARVWTPEFGERTPAGFFFRDTPPAGIRLIELRWICISSWISRSKSARRRLTRSHDLTRAKNSYVLRHRLGEPPPVSALLDMPGEDAPLLLGRQGESTGPAARQVRDHSRTEAGHKGKDPARPR